MDRPSLGTIARNAAHGAVVPSMLGEVAVGALPAIPSSSPSSAWGTGSSGWSPSIRNAVEVATRGGLVHKGTVDVAVLPPAPVAGWTARNLEQRAAAVRQQFIDTLADRPGATS